MRRFWRSVVVVMGLGSATVGGMPACSNRLGPVTAMQKGGSIGHPTLPDTFIEHAKDCMAEHGWQLGEGHHVVNSTMEVNEDRYRYVTIDGIPDTAADFSACMQIALQDLPIAEQPFQDAVETLKYRRQEAIAAQRSLVGHPVVLVIAGVTIVVSEVALEAGAITILFAVSVELIDKASRDVAELAKKGHKKCVLHYTACMATSLSKLGNHWKASVCNTCFEVCDRTGDWPPSIGLGSCNYWERSWGP